MRHFPEWMGLFTALLVIFATIDSRALSADPKLLSLVPPGAEVVAGMDTPPPKDTPGSFVLITHNNRIDLSDFLAITGVDSARSVQHVVFVAMDDSANHLAEHSMLAHGHFDQARIYESAVQGGATLSHYRGLPVLEIEPFARERAEFHDSRWLAITGSDLLFFGTITSVQQELNRYLDHSSTDPVLTQRLARLRHDNETWGVMSGANRSPEVRQVLVGLDRKMGELAGEAESFQFGVRYRRQVEFEYEVTAATSAASRGFSNVLRQSLAGPGNAWMDSPVTTGEGNAVREVVKIPIARFSDWLAEVARN